jgi:hypothetical protein
MIIRQRNPISEQQSADDLMQTLAKTRVSGLKWGMKFHEKLTRLIAESGLEQNEVGRKGKPTTQDLRAFAKFFNVSMDWLYDEALEEIQVSMPPIDNTILTLLRRMKRDAAIDRLSYIDEGVRSDDDRKETGRDAEDPGTTREVSYGVLPNAPVPASRPHPRKSSG